MGKEKDLSEKILEDNNDVFADIVNGFVFGRKQIVQPGDLQNTALESMYRSIHSGAIRSQERDVAKLWTKKGVKIALCGLENQTKIDPYMPMRIMGYEGASYRDMLKSGKPTCTPFCPSCCILAMSIGHRQERSAGSFLISHIQKKWMLFLTM